MAETERYGLSASAARFAKSGTSLTALPSSVTMASRDAGIDGMWAAVR